MISALSKLFIPHRDNTADPAVRRAYGVLCGLVGIALNLLLFAGKFLAGRLAGSIAITADAFNNLSDAGSSVITLLGFKLAAQKPDIEHPFGHGRLEYVSGLVVSLVILLMGVELGQSSLEKILHPQAVEFSPLAVGILVVSIAVKLYMSLYNRTVGKRIDSAAMRATAADSISDCLATTAVLAGTLIGHFFHLSIDGWCGGAVACFILWTGLNAARDTISPLLGQPPTAEFVAEVERQVLSHPEIIGVHDLIVHDYGPGRRYLSIHAEVPASGDILVLHDVVDTVERELKHQLGCFATIHMDPVVNDGGLTDETRRQVAGLVQSVDPSITIHDFRMVPGPTHTNLIFDVVVPYGCPLPDKEVARQIQLKIRAMSGNYYGVIQVEKSYVRTL